MLYQYNDDDEDDAIMMMMEAMMTARMTMTNLRGDEEMDDEDEDDEDEDVSSNFDAKPTIFDKTMSSRK